MTKKDIFNARKKMSEFLDAGRLHDAFKVLRRMSEQNLTWEITDKIDAMEKTYSYMLEYAMQGADDPQRAEVYESLVDTLYNIADRLERKSQIAEAPELYYNTLRYYHRVNQNINIAELINKYNSLKSNSDPFSAVLENRKDETDELLKSKESIERDIFTMIWVSFPISESDYMSIKGEILSPVTKVYFKRLLVSALMLSLMQFYDERKLVLIMDAYALEDDMLSTTALVALLLSLYFNRERHLSTKVRAQLNSVRELPKWKTDLKSAFIELIRTRDTERITRKMREEVVPEMLKMAPKIKPDISNGKMDINDIEENPEWQDMLEKSGLANKMKELSEIQEEGGDVFMGTFAHLKAYSFFSEISNWFLPFHTDHSEVKKIGGDDNIIGELINTAFYLCDNDKYSFILSLSSIPQRQRDMMLSQMKTQNEGMAEMLNSTMQLAPTQRRHLINKYVQNLYRFFQLFRRKGDFNNPFKSEINLTQISSIAEDFYGDDTLRLVAEFYFKHKYYKEALSVFHLCEAETKNEAELYQKMGYCEQSIGNFESALEYYQRAEMLDNRSAWTIRRIAACYRLTGQYDRALEFYKRLDAMVPSNFTTTMMLAECYLRTGDLEQALKMYYKAHYLDEKSKVPLRPLAWTLMMAGQLDRSGELYVKVLADNPSGEDYLNLGHLNVLRHDYKQAVNNYKTAIQSEGWDKERFIKQMNVDFREIDNKYINDKTVALIIDSVLYSLD